MRRRCECGEPIAKVAEEPGGVVLLGVVVLYPETGRATVRCRKCRRVHDLAEQEPHPKGRILARPAHRH